MDLLERYYPESSFGGFSRVDGTIAFYTRVQALLTADALVVDFGCGRGVRLLEDPVPYRRELQTLRSKCRAVIGMDIDPAARRNPGIDSFVLIADSEPWPLADASVGLIISDFVLEHLVDPTLFLTQVARVLKRDGVFCARTTNRLGYVGLLATVIPNRWHSRAVTMAQKNRKAADVFPTAYRINSIRAVRRQLRQAGLQGVVYGHQAEPSYLRFSPTVYRLGKILHSLIPGVLADCLFVFARRDDRS